MTIAPETRCLNCGNDSPCRCTEPMPAADVYSSSSLRQALAPAGAGMGAVTVKPLVWEVRDDIPGLINAESPIGWWYNIHSLFGGRFMYEGDPAAASAESRPFNDLEAAKAAAQTDYERLILAALNTEATG